MNGKEGNCMIVRTYYSTGLFDIFDTYPLVDSSLFPNNALTNYSFDFSAVGGEKTLWMNLYYYEAIDTYRTGELSPAGLPIARRRDGWSFVLADSDDLPNLERVTVDDKDALVRQGERFVFALQLEAASDRAFAINPQAVATHDYYVAAHKGTPMEIPEEELCESLGCGRGAYRLIELAENKVRLPEEEEDHEARY
jgi:hypothetical protein